MPVGACLTDAGCRFRVWAPHRESVQVKLTQPQEQTHAMSKDDQGYWSLELPDVAAGTRYMFVLDGATERPDPASAFQPDGVHGHSEVIDHRTFAWTDQAWQPPELARMIQYELHVGTFSPESTFEGVKQKLPHLTDLGINAIELCPVAQFPGERNWGYDGVYPYAVHNSYGGPEELKALVNAAHEAGLAVILDVVYNHLGPEGNYLHEFAPYFTEKFKTPWGRAMNLDGPYSDDVRDYFVENALMWFRDYHIDALRLDAIHGMFDMSARPFLQELAERVDAYRDTTGDRGWLIAESDLNDTRVITPRSRGGYGIPAQWSDDFHHSLHTLLTGEQGGYYEDFGSIADLQKAMRAGFVYDNKYSPYRKRHHGSDSSSCPADQFVVFSQNHDQVGNRMKGDRLSGLVSFEALKLAAGAVLLGPNIPMLWMGEEWAEPAPFLYFISHGDEALVKAVREGRKEEFAAFGWKETPPDPQAVATFDRCRLDWSLREQPQPAAMLAFYKTLIKYRRTISALSQPSKEGLEVIGDEENRTVACRRDDTNTSVFYFLNFSSNKREIQPPFDVSSAVRLLDSADKEWHGPGALSPETLDSTTACTVQPWSVVLYQEKES